MAAAIAAAVADSVQVLPPAKARVAAFESEVRRRDRDAAENDSPKSEASLPAAAAAAALKKSKSQAHVASFRRLCLSGVRTLVQAALDLYTGLRVQLTVAALIAGNFLMNVIELSVLTLMKWIDPDGDTYPDLWVGADIFFNVSFAIELVWNMYSFWLWRFWKLVRPLMAPAASLWKSAWNVFDVIVVTIGLMNLVLPNLPGPLSLLRRHDEGFPAFRVFRLFKRVESLHKIIKSLSRAVPGVANAFLILLLVMSIYAILGMGHQSSGACSLAFCLGLTGSLDSFGGVEFFGTYANGGNYTNECRDAHHASIPCQACKMTFVLFMRFDEVVEIITARELQFGDENFGNFHRSLFTMFQVLTGNATRVITRPMLHTTDFTQALEAKIGDLKVQAAEGPRGAAALRDMVDKLPEKAAAGAEHAAAEDAMGPTKASMHQSSIAAMEADFQSNQESCSLSNEKEAMEIEWATPPGPGAYQLLDEGVLFAVWPRLHGQRASLLELEETRQGGGPDVRSSQFFSTLGPPPKWGEECVERLHGRRVDIDALLQAERHRVQELETELSCCKEQVKELQRTLKESYVQQFEASQKREELESHFSKLVEELHRMKADKEGLEGQIPQLRKDLKEARALNADQESQLVEATGELSLAEEVIDDITSSKLVGLRRFFEHYNLPAVCLSLFRKVVELQHQLRTRSRLSQTSLASETPRSPRVERTRAIESEVRQLGAALTRCSLQGYVEGLNVDQVTSSMVVQVVLALLGLDLGRAPCDAARFVSLLAAPPAWEQLDFATALWGSAGEPAAAVVQQHRARLAVLSSQGGASVQSSSKLSPRHGSLEERRRDQGVGCRA
ncbi:Scn10a [Symbiodinium sp. CCMP2592]|nr:Scn10a [Symbiodinium sp. CCMP2592]